jgi:hypothetical protein
MSPVCDLLQRNSICRHAVIVHVDNRHRDIARSTSMELILLSGVGTCVLLVALLLEHVLTAGPMTVESAGNPSRRSGAAHAARDVETPYGRAA